MKTFRYFLLAAVIIATVVQSACALQTSPAGTVTPSSPAGNTLSVTPLTPPVVIPPGTPATSPGNPPNAAASPPVSGDYVVLAWNDLGMHCLNSAYDTAVLLPPYNTLWAQVVKRGNPPQIVTGNVNVEYRIINNTYSYGKLSYGQFWDNAAKLFDANLAKDTGLNLSDPGVHNGLSGKMALATDHFTAEGIPLVPVTDAGVWDPYQVAEITVKDGQGKVLARTRATAPVSDEINCGKCHGADAFKNILSTHDRNIGTSLSNRTPVLCASCHADPALGAVKTAGNNYLSKNIHGFHSRLAVQPTCYDCHPGPLTQCSRSLSHTDAEGKCITCHGSLSEVASSIATGARVPWVNEPACADCHNNIPGVDTGTTLYRNAVGHGGLYCASCHTSPHAMVPSRTAADNFQAVQLQNGAETIGSCGACHRNSRGEGANGVTDIRRSEFDEEHGGVNPEERSACNICHTSVSLDTTKWPHNFEWKGR